MFKFYSFLGGIILFTQFSYAQITTSAQLVTHIKSLDDDSLIKHLRRFPKSFGSCSFSQAITSVACPYRVRTKANTIICFTNHIMIPAVAAVKGSWSNNPNASAFSDAQQYMNSVRTTLQGVTDAKSRAISFIRNTLLSDPTVCDISISDNQPSVSKTFDDFKLEDLKFSRSTNGKQLICSTSKFSLPRWDANNCAYVKGVTYLPKESCQTLYNKLSRTSSGGVTSALNPISFVPYTADVAKEYSISLLSESVTASIPEANGSVAFYDAISPDVMVINELLSSQVELAASQEILVSLLAQYYRLATTAAQDSKIEISSDVASIKNQLSGYPNIVTASQTMAAFNAATITAAKTAVLQAADVSVIANISNSGATPPVNVYNVISKCPSQLMQEKQESNSF